MFDGHINIGKRLTIYGNNAMHWGVTFWTKKYGYICFRLPFRSCGKWWRLYFYCSPNATTWAATFMLGRRRNLEDWSQSRVRRSVLGHNFEIHGWNDEYQCQNYDILRGINRSVGVYAGNYAKWQKEHPER